MSDPRQLHQHQRSSSTGSHGLFFNTSHPLNHGANLHHQIGQYHLGHNAVHQSNGSPDVLSDLSDDDDWTDQNDSNCAPELQGTLSKWTNYIHGWQDRFIALKEGSLVYYKSEVETDFGCRGAISIDKAMVKPHELDELRFDVSVSDCVWYLRTNTVEDRQKWIDTIEAHKRFHHSENPREGLPNSHQMLMNSLRHHDSALSLASNASKGAFGGSCNGGPAGRGSSAHRSLTEKLAEIETYRDILCRQIETLQSYFDACADVAQNHSNSSPKHHNRVNTSSDKYSNGFQESGSKQVSRNNSSDGCVENLNSSNISVNKELVLQHGIHAVDFKGEAITFKATTAGILATMAHCIEIMSQREEHWKRKLDREQLVRKKLEEKLKSRPETVPKYTGINCSEVNPNNKNEENLASKPKSIPKIVGGTDYEEGPLSQIGEDEFFDAVESALDKLQEEQDYKDKLKKMSLLTLPEEISVATNHQLWPTINQVTNEQLGYARMEVGEGVWELFAEDGQMKMYKREEEVDGMVMDPLKALHEVRGVTARELCHYFFVPDVRMEWETTVEEVTVLEKIAPDTLIFLQLHKRVWPAAQRDALFWSHMRHLGEDASLKKSDSGTYLQTDSWMVCNKSTKHPDAPENQGGCLRVGLTVCFVCDTFIDKPYTKETAGRNNITTKITYCSVVNPGGWAPASVLRTVFKREYPRFLKRFTQYVIDKSKDKPVYW